MSNTDSIVPDLEIPVLDNTIDDIDEFDQEVEYKKRGKGTLYDVYETIENKNRLLEKYQAEINEHGIVNTIHFDGNRWKYTYKRNVKDGYKFFFKCKPKDAQCKAVAYLQFFYSKDNINVYKSDVVHEHIDKSSKGIDNQTKELIKRLFNNGITAPKALLRALENEKNNDK
jgi:hypothetical protein